jgi:phospholipid/cholesterol/gamma-HCH transport system permease protein
MSNDKRPPTIPPQTAAVGKAAAAGVRDAVGPVYRFIETVGAHFVLLFSALRWLPRRPWRPANYLEAIEYIGFGSLPIIVLVGAFTGMVTSLQAVYVFRLLEGFDSFAGVAAGKALAIELAPVLTALMLAGRAGSGIATEIGTMRISEQIDALESMAVNPIQFLVLPRIVAGLLVAPILSLIFFVVGMAGAFFVAVVIQGVDQGQFIANTKNLMRGMDVVQGLIKSAFFGVTIVLIGCYQGYNASGGGRGVGIGTTRAVVIGSVSVLVMDYFLTDVLLTVLAPQGGLT